MEITLDFSWIFVILCHALSRKTLFRIYDTFYRVFSLYGFCQILSKLNKKLKMLCFLFNFGHFGKFVLSKSISFFTQKWKMSLDRICSRLFETVRLVLLLNSEGMIKFEIIVEITLENNTHLLELSQQWDFRNGSSVLSILTCKTANMIYKESVWFNLPLTIVATFTPSKKCAKYWSFLKILLVQSRSYFFSSPRIEIGKGGL